MIKINQTINMADKHIKTNGRNVNINTLTRQNINTKPSLSGNLNY